MANRQPFGRHALTELLTYFIGGGRDAVGAAKLNDFAVQVVGFNISGATIDALPGGSPVAIAFRQFYEFIGVAVAGVNFGCVRIFDSGGNKTAEGPMNR